MTSTLVLSDGLIINDGDIFEISTRDNQYFESGYYHQYKYHQALVCSPKSNEVGGQQFKIKIIANNWVYLVSSKTNTFLTIYETLHPTINGAKRTVSRIAMRKQDTAPKSNGNSRFKFESLGNGEVAILDYDGRHLMEYHDSKINHNAIITSDVNGIDESKWAFKMTRVNLVDGAYQNNRYKPVFVSVNTSFQSF
ncbi:hypothetical protein L4C34_11860 [Vibrio profundum]|uniref:hypothetical protein n=1 Tax=Vibrio profundum TaxID=2910247 RepID=UPI003D0CCABC